MTTQIIEIPQDLLAELKDRATALRKAAIARQHYHRANKVLDESLLKVADLLGLQGRECIVSAVNFLDDNYQGWRGQTIRYVGGIRRGRVA